MHQAILELLADFKKERDSLRDVLKKTNEEYQFLQGLVQGQPESVAGKSVVQAVAEYIERLKKEAVVPVPLSINVPQG